MGQYTRQTTTNWLSVSAVKASSKHDHYLVPLLACQPKCHRGCPQPATKKFSWIDPWVECQNTGWLKISHVARHDGHAVHKRRRSDQAITNRARVRYMESCAALSDSTINDQNATIEGWDDMPIQPRPEYCTLRWITTFRQQNTDF